MADTVVRGSVRAIRTERGNRMNPYVAIYEQVWRFTVESPADGGHTRVIPVEMRGFKFEGALSEGDEVEISGTWKEGSTVRLKKLKNFSLGIVFEAK